MSYVLSPELSQMIEAKLATGAYPSANHLLVEAMHALEDLEIRGEKLRSEIRSRLVSVGTGLARPLDLEAFKAEARQRLAQRMAKK
jgi:Arc/MetJ-type ribon-helix-helix transcriptional regulator